MFIKILTTLVIVLYIGINIFTSKICSAKEMREDLIDGQCAVGMICANVFYAPAWALKLLKHIVLVTIK
ncbi:MAG: hypothetical protein IKY16_07080 [Bacteroidales bacterium]|nr:hypothetical protein [Bacteroidales bacterium]